MYFMFDYVLLIYDSCLFYVEINMDTSIYKSTPLIAL